MRVEVRLKYSEMVHVEQERLRAILTSELGSGGDERTNRLHVHLDIRRGAAIDNVVGLCDGPVEPRRCALQCESRIVELLLELFALIVHAMMDDNRRDEPKARIGGVDAHDVDAIEEKLQLIAQSARCLVVSLLDVDRLELLPLGFRLPVALG